MRRRNDEVMAGGVSVDGATIDGHRVDRSVDGRVRRRLGGRPARLAFAVSMAVLAVALGAGFMSLLTTEVEASAGNVPPVQATYHGVKPYNSISSGTLQYDAWTYGDIAFYSPPGKVTQEMANQWLAWYATTDDILRTLINDDAHFEGRFRGNDPNFGRVKVIGTPPDSCGAGCGNKQIAEGVGIIDNMVAEPDNYEHHWILFYEQARGGVDETFDLAASWPREAYHLPHLIAALTYYEIGGIEGVQRGVPGDIYGGLQKWDDLNRQYVDQFVEREQRWFDDPYPDGGYIYPPQTSMLLHIALNDGIGTLGRVLGNVGQYPDNFMYENSTDALCDWQTAVNDATGGRYADRMVNDWGLPGNCGNQLAQAGSPAGHPNDLRFEASGLCADPNYKPASAMIGHFPCDGSADQQFSIVNDRGDGTFSVAIGTDRCLDASGTRVVAWSCHGGGNQMWQWNGDSLQQPDSGLCVTAHPRTRWGGGLLSLDPCADSPTQRINTDGPVIVVTPEPTPTPTPEPEPEPESTTTTEAPTTTTAAPTTTTVASTEAPSGESTTTAAPTTAAPTTAAPTTAAPTTAAPSTTAPSTTMAPTTAAPTPAPTATATPPTTQKPSLPAGEFFLVNLASDKCVDQPSSQEELGEVIQWTCHGGSHQVLNAIAGRDGFMLAFTHSGKCLDMWLGDFYQYTCNGGDNQLFNWDGAQLRLRDGGQCLTVAEDSLDNRANVHLAPCENRPGQQFRAQMWESLFPYW